MKQPRINRRQFFKLGAFGASALALPCVALGAVASAPTRAAQAATVEPHKLAIPQPAFTAIASTLPAGNAPADISMGWDGTLWAVDASGAPHVYDPTQDAWLVHGHNLSAATWVGNAYYWFIVVPYTNSAGFPATGVQVATAAFGGNVSAPQLLQTAFPNVPDSFALSLTGAANVDGALYLFNGGRFAQADNEAAPIALTSLANWPTSAAWADGVIDAVHSDGTANVMLFNGAQFVIANLVSKTVTSGPASISSYAPWLGRLPADWATTGIDAAFTQGNNVTVYKGTQLVAFDLNGSGPTTPQYIPSVNEATWPVTWHPILNHAPSGRMGNLWAATTSGGVVMHDGEGWNVRDNSGNGAGSVSVGRDGSAWLGGASSQTLWQWNGTSWTNVATSSVSIAQVTAGDANHVFVRGTDNGVQQLGANNSFAAINLGANVPAPTHMSANADGTLWHCNSSNATAFRLVSEATSPSDSVPVKNGVVTNVHKVASTGFGSSHVLATQSGATQPQVYRYDSPYVFKTGTPYNISNYGTIEHGLGLLYLLIEDGWFTNQTLTYYVVAVDAHTGAEVARTAALTGKRYGGLVFDPIHELVYVGTTPLDPSDQDTVCDLFALDARTLKPVWSFTNNLVAGIDAAPGLHGTHLCFGSRNGFMFMLDTDTHKERWYYGPQPPGGIFQQNIRLATPVFDNGRVYQVEYMLTSLGAGVVFMYAADANDRANDHTFDLGTISQEYLGDLFGSSVVFPPVMGLMSFDPVSGYLPTVFVNGGSTVYAVDATAQWGINSFTLSASSISSGFAYDDGSRLGPPQSGGTPYDPLSRRRLWFGDNKGSLWSLFPDSIGGSPISDNTPYQFKQNTSITTTPVLYKDPQGGVTVLFGVFDLLDTLIGGGVPSLYGYDPENGNVASMPTGVTQLLVLSKDTTNGVIYAGGVDFQLVRTATGQIPQIFAIRVDELPQALRDFVIESQLMQDPDPNASGGDPSNNVPPSVARYQTHLTVVDDQKNALVHEPVKIWCDVPNIITVAGQPYLVGPGDSEYAAVKTGADGSVVITMNATDYFATPLRVWASFMDPFERIVVSADTEFHQRVATAHANASDDNPDKVNLMTAANYSGKSLFTDDEKNGNPSQPQQMGNSIQAADKALGLSTADNKAAFRKLMRAMGVKHKNQRIQVQIIEATPPPEKYMAYADLPGAAHFPTNVPSNRLASIAQPMGLSYSRPNGDKDQAPVFTSLSHTEARTRIDALTGTPWKPNDPYGNGGTGSAPMRTLNIFQDFWNWLKKLFDKVLQCLLSIAEDIMAGIQYLVDGVLKVFKAILKVLADVFPFLGSFFKMLEKLIDDVVEALSVLLHFGEIMWTHRWLADQFTMRMSDMSSAISTTIKQNIDSFFGKGEAAVKALFDKLRADVNNGMGINNLKGAGATPHTMFTIGPRGGTASSHAPQCTYGTNKLKENAPAATTSLLQLGSNHPAASSGDPASDFLNAFVGRLSSDPVLKSAFAQVSTDGRNLLHPASAKGFFASLIDTLLDVLEVLIVGALAVANALIDGLLAVIQDAINAVTGILTAEIEIPFLTWLYKTLFNEPLTFLNLATLVAAIPVTIICRVVEGQYPSTLFPPVSALQAMQTTRAGAVPDIIIRYLGIFNGILAFAYGTVNAIGDAAGDDAPAIVSKISLGVGLMMEAFSFPLIANDLSDVSSDDWAVYGIGLAAALLGIGGVSYEGSDGKPTSPIDGAVQSVLTAILNVTLLAATVVAFVEDGKTDAGTDVGFAGGLVTTLPGVINPLKLAPEPAPLVVGAVDFIAGCVVGALLIADAIITTEPAPTRRRLFFPWVAFSPQAFAVQP